MTKLMQADDARRETLNAIDAKTDDILNEIAAGIQDSTRRGEFVYDIYKPLTDKAIIALRKNGYEIIDISSPMDGCCIRISWEED